MLTRTRRRALVALVPLAAVPVLVAATHGSRHLTALSCGDTITASTTLSADLGPCGGNGVVIGADHVTLNLNGHRILGSGGSTGVLSGHTSVVVQNGAVVAFASNIGLSGDSSRVVNLHVSGATANGIAVGGQNSVISGNRVFGNGLNGIFGTGAGSQYTNNVLQSNVADGIAVNNASVISGNKALNNGSQGINLSNGARASMTVTNNIANGNHLNGIAESGSDATVVTMSGNKAYFNLQFGINGAPGVTDGGNNKAGGNANAAQCNNVVCS
jgi:hypothetical protein